MLAALTSWLIQWATYLGITCLNLLVDCANAAIIALVTLVRSVVSLLPSGPSLPIPNQSPAAGADVWVVLLKSLNWFFPVGFVVSSFEFVVASLLAYVVIAPLARWVKLLR